MNDLRRSIRIALPSKGLLAEGSRKLLADVGFTIYNPNPRQYRAQIPNLPGIEVIFQRPGDIVVSVRDGSVDFGITGRDVYLENRGANGNVLELHSKLGFGKCTLNVIVPESWETTNHIEHLQQRQAELGRPLRIATKFPNLTQASLSKLHDLEFQLIQAEGTLEIAPTVGYADIIVDLVSTGTTLRDNRLKCLSGGEIVFSEACLIANKVRLKTHSETLATATQLLEFVGAHLRANDRLAIFANVRGRSPENIAQLVFQQETISGLQGPTISQVITQQDEKWFAVHLIVRKKLLHQAIREIRKIGGSGVVVSPVSYIFEEEPKEVSDMMSALEN